MSNNIRFMHVRNFGRGGKRNATVAYSLTEDGYINYATAYCSTKDQFNKAMGRKISKGRLNVGTMNMFPVSQIGSDRYREVHKFLKDCVVANHK